jgi:chromosome segregation ATPase
MYKYQQKLQEYGLTEASVSSGLRKKFDSLKAIQKEVDKFNQELDDTDDDDQDTIDSLNDKLDDLEANMEALDESIAEEVTKYNNNKDKYAEMGKKLQAGREAKKNAKAPAAAAAPAAAEAAPAATAEPAAPAAEPAKEKSSGSGILLGGLLVLITGGLVWWNYSKK